MKSYEAINAPFRPQVGSGSTSSLPRHRIRMGFRKGVALVFAGCCLLGVLWVCLT